MIFEIIKILADQVANHTDQTVTLNNIADLGNGGGGVNGFNNRTIVTLVNYDEEGSMRNNPNNKIVNGKNQLQQPTVSLNLFVLFSNTKNTYSEALKDISQVMEFFQSHRVFTQANTIFDRNNVDFDNIDNFRFHVDLHSISFEDLNYIWGSLGGKQVPSALYKIRLVHIAESNVINQSGIIQETTTSANHLT